MINAIGDPAVQQTLRSAYAGPVGEKPDTVRQAEKARAQRPVETAKEGKEQSMDAPEKETTAKYVLEKTQIAYEKYDKNGDLILRVPPAKIPVDTRA